jgi:ATP-dependent DNA helicase RecG
LGEARVCKLSNVTSVDELRDRLKKPLLLELRTGCQDSAVVGGIEKLVNTVGKPFADVREIVSGYGDLNSEQRQERLEQAIALLGGAQPLGLEVEPGAVGKGEEGEEEKRGDNLSSSSPPSLPLLPSDFLDHDLTAKILDLGAQAPKKLASVGIKTYRDLLYYFPRRYEDRRTLPHFGMLRDQDTSTVIGVVTGRKAMKARTGMTIVRAFLEDDYGGKLTAVWFNQPWLEKQLFPGQRIILSGKVRRKGRLIEINVANFEIDEEGTESLSFDRIVGVYPTTQGLSQAYIRRAAHRLLQAIKIIPEHLPKSVLERYSLIPFDEAVREIHFPSDEKFLQRATRRLKFDEFFFLELRVLLNRDTTLLGKKFTIRQKDFETFQSSLPFKMTNAQQRALREIFEDMANPRQMARLLQGDVGSGKTAVAAAAIYVAVKNGYQAAMMAPTEILARQHFLNLKQYLFPLGVTSELLMGTMSSRERQEARTRVAKGQAHLAIGTHALIQEGVEFQNLGLAVIDEEHRFGVEQRRKLLQANPDVLVMSATPIPRSLALTYYGDLELSIIDELPPGRKPIKTRLVNDSKRRDVYKFAWGEIQKGRQVYLVTPLIEESEALEHIVSTTQMYDDLRAIMPTQCRIEMLHGKMLGGEKDDIMERFRRHEFDLLVSTTVIEVGVDIPNASVMIIENAERFGLSQLHQLRGRVGRGEHESYCILVAGDRSKKTQHRLEVIEKYTDGFVIAEKDLELRGPGEIRGTRQSGLPDLVLGDLAQDGDIIEKARELAKKMLEADPKLEAGWASRLKAELKRRSEAVGFREII